MNPKHKSSVNNPYTDPTAGFTTRFYEIRKEAASNRNELWDHGQLYDHPLGWSFRKSAFTVSTQIYWPFGLRDADDRPAIQPCPFRRLE